MAGSVWPVKHVVMFSGGVGSWAAAKRVAQTWGTDDLGAAVLRRRRQA